MRIVDFDIDCVICGHPLRGESLNGKCANCCTPVDVSLNTAALDMETNCVVTDTNCVSCGYNIRTLDLLSNCPECGSPVAKSLELSPPISKRVLTGINRLLLASICIPALFILAINLLGYWSRSWIIPNIFLAILAGIFASGAFRVAEIRPSPFRSSACTCASWSIRLGFILAGAIILLAAGRFFRPGFISAMIVMISLVTGFSGILFCLAKTARKNRHRTLRTATRITAFMVITIAITAILEFNVFGFEYGSVPYLMWHVVAQAMEVICPILLLLSYLSFVVLLFCYRRLLTCNFGNRFIKNAG